MLSSLPGLRRSANLAVAPGCHTICGYESPHISDVGPSCGLFNSLACFFTYLDNLKT